MDRRQAPREDDTMATGVAPRTHHPFHMYEAIQAQPEAVAECLARHRETAPALAQELSRRARLLLAGIGTSFHAAVVGEYLFRLASSHRVDARAVHSFELVHYGRVSPGDALVVLSHRGTKTFSIEALEAGARQGILCVAVTGRGHGPSMAQAAVVLETVPQEVSAAHTVSYTAALATLALVARETGSSGAPAPRPRARVPVPGAGPGLRRGPPVPVRRGRAQHGHGLGGRPQDEGVQLHLRRGPPRGAGPPRPGRVPGARHRPRRPRPSRPQPLPGPRRPPGRTRGGGADDPPGRGGGRRARGGGGPRPVAPPAPGAPEPPRLRAPAPALRLLRRGRPRRQPRHPPDRRPRLRPHALPVPAVAGSPVTDAVVASRIQFAFTVMFHYLFPILTMGLAPLIVVLKTRHLLTGDETAAAAARLW